MDTHTLQPRPSDDQKGLPTHEYRARRLAHEIRNPLNAMRMQAAVIQSRLKNAQDPGLDVAREHLELFNVEIGRLEQVVKTFLEDDRHLHRQQRAPQ